MQGIRVEVPAGWEVRIRRAYADVPGSRVFPVVHASTTPLPTNRADYGGGVVERLQAADVFVSLIEFGEEAVASSLYPMRDSVPTLTFDMFQPFQLQRRIRGQAGTQVFFSMESRAFCLYVVLGSFGRREELTAIANELVSRIAIDAPPEDPVGSP